MPIITDPVEYWDHYAEGVANEEPEEALQNAFGWTQYDGHGPGDELLGEPLATLELGSMYGNGFNGRQVWIYRWAYEPSAWAELLHEHGFVGIHARIEPAPQPDNVGTLLVEARRER